MLEIMMVGVVEENSLACFFEGHTATTAQILALRIVCAESYVDRKSTAH